MPPRHNRSRSLWMIAAGLLLTGHTISTMAADPIELSAAQREKCLSVLRASARSDEFWPSIHAAEGLTLAGNGDEVRKLLKPKLDRETDDQHLCGIARELVRAGDRNQVAVMLQILASKDDYGHVHACESLYKVNEIGDGRLMRAALKQKKNPRLALMAGAALGRWGNPHAFDMLRKQVLIDDPDTARTAAWILARIGDASDIPALRKGAKRFGEELTRAYFQHALAALGDEAGLAALARNLNSEDAAVRTYAATFAGDARAVGVKGRLLELLDDENIDVRVRSAQSLMVLAQPAPPDRNEVIVRDVYPATDANPRKSEGSIVALPDGSLLYATTEFQGGGSDFSSANIVARSSSDGGRTWSPQRVMQENIGKKNVMSVTLRYLESPVRETTPLGMFYLVKNSFEDLDVYLRISPDHGKTFGQSILVTDVPGYHVLNNDRVTLLSSGRLVVPVSSTADVRKVNHFVCSCFLSDDGGKTWTQSTGKVDYAKRGAMEPEVVELAGGILLMIIRTQLGHIAFSESSDRGDTWSKPKPMEITAPEAPATLRVIPSTGDLLLIWNDTFKQGVGHGGKRTPLTAAVLSGDATQIYQKRQLETDPEKTYAYTSLTFVQGRAVMSYYVRDEKTGRISSRFRSVPIGWFYDAED